MERFYIEIRSKHVFTIAIVISLLSLGFTTSYAIWKKDSYGLNETDFRQVEVDPNNPANIFASTASSIYKSVNGGQSYTHVLRINAEPKGINRIFIDPQNSDVIYAATNAGLYKSKDHALSWQRIYYASDVQARMALSVMVVDSDIYLGTAKGLFKKQKDDHHWQPVISAQTKAPVFDIVYDDSHLYWMTGHEVFKKHKDYDQEEIVFSSGLNAQDISESEEVFDVNQLKIRFIKAINLSNQPHPHIIIASYQGLFVSFDYGQAWQSLPHGQLTFNQITSILSLPNNEPCLEDFSRCLRLMVSTLHGVYIFENLKWRALYKGMETNQVYDLAQGTDGMVYAATNRGVFSFNVKSAESPKIISHTPVSVEAVSSPKPEINYSKIQETFKNEPSINVVHEMAIDYAEVHPEKIKEWRRLAKRKALYPSFDLGVDYGEDSSHSDSLWGSSSSGGTSYVGPDDKSGGRDFGIDVSLSWDLADFVWSSDQTSIDSRSKLMVELREDILDQATRIYFERRRLQMDLMTLHFDDPQFKLDKHMRIDELTALLDALTGGEFSRELRRVTSGER